MTKKISVKKVRKKLINHAQDTIFKNIHGNRLIYNTCWEDPRIDRELLELDSTSQMVMITSAGCNALDYLLDSPAKIHTIDVNPRQNALLHLKLSLFRHGSYEDIYSMFGKGYHYASRDLYQEGLRASLPNYAQDFWDKKIRYFEHKKPKRSFYYYSTSGDVAWLLNQFLKTNKKIRSQLYKLLEAQNLDEQREIYAKIEPKLWNKLIRWVIKHPMMMAMVGVPRPQMQLINDQYPGGLVQYVRDSLKHLSTEVAIHDNYFWRVYLTGSYTKTCSPNYLKAENFELLRQNSTKIHTYNTTFTEFLKCHPGPYSHYILLDHQDWLAWHAPEVLAEEWNYILMNSQPGTKILLRSAALELDFLPPEAEERLKFFPEKTVPLHQQDRVGTYGSLHFAEVIS